MPRSLAISLSITDVAFLAYWALTALFLWPLYFIPGLVRALSKP